MADNIEILIKARQEASDAIDEIVASVKALDNELKGIRGDSFSGVDESADKASDSMEELEDSAHGAADAAKDLEKTKGPEDLEEGARDTEEELRKLRDTLGEVQEAALLLTAAGGAVLAFFGTGAKSAAEFRLQIAEISTIVDSAVVSNNALAEAVSNVSATYGTDTQRTAKALYDIISSGAKAGEQANQVLNASARLATAGITDIGVAADGLTTIMNSFGEEAGSVDEIADKLFKTVEGGKTTVEELSEAMFQAAPVAASLGIPLDDVLGSIVALTKQGTPTKIAFTGVRQLLVSLAKPTEELAQGFQEYAGASSEVVLANRGLGAAIEVIQKTAGGSAAEMVKLVGSVEAYQAVAGIAAQDSQFFNEGLESIANSAGAVDTATAKIQAEPMQQLAIAGEQLAAAFRDIGELVLPLVADLVGLIGDLAQSVSEFVEDNETLSRVVAVLVVSMAGLITIVGAVTLAVVTLRKTKLTLVTVLGKENGLLATQNALLGKNAQASTTAAAASGRMATSVGTISTALKGMVAGAIRLVPALAAVYGVMKLFQGFEFFAESEANLNQFQRSFGEAKFVIDNFNRTLEDTNESLAEGSKEALDASYENLRDQLDVINKARQDFAKAQQKNEILGVGVGRGADAERGRQLQDQFNSLLAKINEVDAARQKAFGEAGTSGETAVAKDFELTEAAAELLANNLRNLNSIRFDQVNSQIDQLKSKLEDIRVLGGSDQEAARLEEQISALTVDAARQRADELTAIAEQEALDKRRIAERTITNEKERAEELRSIALDLADDRIQIQQDYEAQLTSSLDAAIQRQRQAAQDVLSLESRIADERRAGAEQLRSIQGKELSEYQRYVELQKEISKARADAAQAEEVGDLTALEEAGRRQRELAEQLAELESVRFDSGREYLNEEQTIAQATRVSKEATDNIVAALERRKTLAQETKEASEEEAASLRESLSTIRQEITRLGEQAIKLPIEVDPDVIDEVFSQVEQSLRDRKFSVGLTVDSTEAGLNDFFEEIGQDQLVTIKPRSEELDSKLTEITEKLDREYEVRIRYNELNRPQGFAGGGEISIPGFAGGGRISGPGTPTSDSVLIAASRDEFMMRNAAVKKYGLDFMYAVNRLQLPTTQKFATGGSISRGPDRVSGGDAAPGDTVNLNLDLGSGPIRLFGDREEVRKMADSLQRLKRGS